jgi:phosphate transport system substrate-binding protein
MQFKLLLPILILSFYANLAQAEVLDYQGSSTIGRFITDASEHYDATFKINTISESSGGEQCALRQRCDMGGVAREINQQFIDAGLVGTLIAKDAIAVLVNSNNPITELSSEQLRDIFTGKITNWAELGGEDLLIRPYVVKPASATRHVFAATVLAGENYHNVETISPDVRIALLVAQERGGIGQLSFAFLGDRHGIKTLIVDGQEASVNNPDYPITRPLYIATHGQPSGKVKNFLDWTLSPQGQEIIKQRFVGVN